MKKSEFQTHRTNILSKMLDNPNKYGIYPTSEAFNALDSLFDELKEKEKENYIKIFAAGVKCGQLHPEDDSYDNLLLSEAIKSLN